LSSGPILSQASFRSWDAFSNEILALTRPSALALCNLCCSASALVQAAFSSFSAALPSPCPLPLAPCPLPLAPCPLPLGLCLLTEVVQLFLPFVHGAPRLLNVRVPLECRIAAGCQLDACAGRDRLSGVHCTEQHERRDHDPGQDCPQGYILRVRSDASRVSHESPESERVATSEVYIDL
jgi:hypothetical protein